MTEQCSDDISMLTSVSRQERRVKSSRSPRPRAQEIPVQYNMKTDWLEPVPTSSNRIWMGPDVTCLNNNKHTGICVKIKINGVCALCACSSDIFHAHFTVGDGVYFDHV